MEFKEDDTKTVYSGQDKEKDSTKSGSIHAPVKSISQQYDKKEKAVPGKINHFNQNI